MSNHSGKPLNINPENSSEFGDKMHEFAELWGNAQNPPQLVKNPYDEPGPTGKFPEGKLTPDDEGEIKMNIGLLEGKVVIHFGRKPIAWVAMTKDQALQLSELIAEKANQLNPVV